MSFFDGVKSELGRTVVQIAKWAILIAMIAGVGYGAYYYVVERPKRAAINAVQRGREAVGKAVERAGQATAPVRDKVNDAVQDAYEAGKARIDDLRARLPGAKSKSLDKGDPAKE